VPWVDTEKQIYLKKKEIKVGFGGTSKVTEIRDYYEVVAVDETRLKCRLLDMDGQPTGWSMVIRREELKEYTPCPDYCPKPKKAKD
jgi:hypothetical protein